MSKLRPTTGALLWGTLLIVLLLLIGLSTALQPGADGHEALANRSIYNSGDTGYRAWYITLQEAGVPLIPWQEPFDELGTLGDPLSNRPAATMLIVEPYSVSGGQWTFNDEQVSELLHWVGRGNRLILLDSFRRQGSRTLLRKSGLQLKGTDTEERHPFQKGKPATRTEQPALITHMPRTQTTFVHQPVKANPAPWLAPRENNVHAARAKTLMVNDAGHPVVMGVGYGKGTLVLGTTPDLASNAYLHRPVDNYQWLANVLISGAAGGELWINEYVHGYFETPDLLSYYEERTPLGGMFLQLAFTFAVLVWFSMLPLGPHGGKSPESEEADEAGGMKGTIESMAGFYYKAQASALVLSPILKQLDSRFRKRLRVSLQEPASRWQPVLERHLLACDTIETPAADLLNSLQKARRIVGAQERVPHRELVQLAQHLSMIDDSLRPQTERQPSHG